MDTALRESIVQQGMTQIYSGLGILLGAGKISPTTHANILALVNGSEVTTAAEAAVKEAVIAETVAQKATASPLDVQPVKETFLPPKKTEDISAELGALSVSDLSDRFRSRGPTANKSSAATSPAIQRDSWRDRDVSSSVSTPPPPAAESGGLGGDFKLICPWWSTPGFSCRQDNKVQGGDCEFYHNDIPNALKDPLICCFWADGGRCTKAEDECRFAHYPAQHRQVAPVPKKVKKARKTARDLEEVSAAPPPPRRWGDEDEW